jgi:hypothetical protein
VKTNTGVLQLEKLGFGCPSRYQPPLIINGDPTPENDMINFSSGRCWISPRVTDFNCKSRIFTRTLPSIIAERFATIITGRDIDAFGSIPLSVIGLNDFVEFKSLSDRNITPVSAASPLEVLNHPSSRSHIARTSVHRLEIDIRDFANDENISLTPIIKNIYTNDLPNKTKDEFEHCVILLNRLTDELNKLKSKDALFVNNGIEEIVNCTNGDGVIGARRVNDFPILRHKLYQYGGLESVLVS